MPTEDEIRQREQELDEMKAQHAREEAEQHRAIADQKEEQAREQGADEGYTWF
jgi:hypothetical protein